MNVHHAMYTGDSDTRFGMGHGGVGGGGLGTKRGRTGHTILRESGEAVRESVHSSKVLDAFGRSNEILIDFSNDKVDDVGTTFGR